METIQMNMIPLFCPPLMTSNPSQAATNTSTSPTAPPKPTVFVAGAAGNVGRRVVRKLVEAGCNVRAGSRNPDKCRGVVGSVENESLVEYIQFDVTQTSKISSAIGGADVVVSTLGAPFSFGKVDGWGIAQLMSTGAKLDSVTQLIVVSSIGVGRPWAFPAALLNLFGGVLLFKDWSEQVTRKVARDNGKGYLIVRPGGMEAQGDDFGETHNVKLEGRNRLAGGVVSSLQIAEVIVAAILNPEVASGKTVEVVAEKEARKTELDVLLQKAARD